MESEDVWEQAKQKWAEAQQQNDPEQRNLLLVTLFGRITSHRDCTALLDRLKDELHVPLPVPGGDGFS
uniref:Uncharacterized protein n=1 Tax=Chromera velia CCMP2878 TaxID=1169474 RepID=A0A0G4I280_9ALVE|eukprot:Cvel_34949.t1-p1 / transcript=Cvel_34949.t1 / gene=Cvel_34949 / organism=Chromera_velia_CCMP2878 / gene_product=hypothetical protein / transcript_product=hypothetical protein / location=Cvel_scaffold6192:2130-2330(-) / protein_length=67 / sequence_SO=supercontig / SO=protein_coding / is_pseudo=false